MDLKEILRDIGIDFRIAGEHHHTTQGWIQIDCMYCSPASGKFRLGLNLRSGAANCWICGKHRLSDVLYELTGSRQHFRHLEFDFRHLEFDFHSSDRLPSKKLVKKEVKLPEGLGPLLPVQISYLRERNFDPANLVQLWNLQGFGLHPKYPWRIFIPVYYQGELVSFLTRSLGNREPRYLNADPEDEKLPLKSLLFGEDFVRHTIIICEGCFDAMKIGPGAVATLGTGYTREQLAKMVEYPIRVICFDSEEPAQARARELAQEIDCLGRGGETINIILESGKDPAEASEEEIQELRKTFLEDGI